MRRGLCLVIVAGMMPILPAAAAAQSTGTERPWIVTVGLWTLAKPSFGGSDDLEASVKPIFQFRREGEREWLNLPSDHGGPALFRTERFRFGPSLNFIGERKAVDHATLAGLGDVPWAIEGGVYAEFWPTSGLRSRVELRRGFNGHEGVIANLSADFVLRPDVRWMFTIGPRLAIADGVYMGTYYGVTNVQSATSGLQIFDPKAGLYSAGVGASVKHQWTQSWATVGYAQFDRLVGDAANSPITVRGSPDQVTIGIGVAYSFQWNGLKISKW